MHKVYTPPNYDIMPVIEVGVRVDGRVALADGSGRRPWGMDAIKDFGGRWWDQRLRFAA